MWRATVLTLFPDLFPGPLAASLAGKALASGLWSLEPLDIRASATDRHRTVDDTPAGGGPGMVMKPDVLARAIDAVPPQGRPRLLMSPRGKPLTQARVEALARGQPARLRCDREYHPEVQRLIGTDHVDGPVDVDLVYPVPDRGQVAGGIVVAAVALADGALIPGAMSTVRHPASLK